VTVGLRAIGRASVGVIVTVGVVCGMTPQVLAARAAATKISITASSNLPIVTHDVWTLFGDTTGSSDAATLTGTVTGAPSKSMARLMARVFPYKKAPSKLASEPLTSSAGISTYSFQVVPALATRYFVEIFSSSSKRLAKSSTVTVYVSAYAGVSSSTPVTSCNATGQRPVCHQHFEVLVSVPASLESSMSSRHRYDYFGLKLSPTKEPAPPKYLLLAKGWTLTVPKKISSTTYEFSISFSFTVGTDGYYFDWNLCTKDTEPKNGLGLPGSHGCGTHKILADTPYLG
jgi:hypothetical protein